MYKRYFRKKDPDCPLEEVEWIEMTGKEYYHFVSAPENKNRYFIDMEDVVLEGTRDEARDQRAEKDHSDYLKEQEAGWNTLSIYAINGGSECNGEEVIQDETQDVEAEAILRANTKDLYAALDQLDTASYLLIHALYLADEAKTFRQLSKESGIPVMTLQYRKEKALALLQQMLSKKI